MSEWEPSAQSIDKAKAKYDAANPFKTNADHSDALEAALKAAVAADPLLRSAADLRAALIEAQAALNGAPNTQGLHSQIEAALRASDRGAGHE